MKKWIYLLIVTVTIYLNLLYEWLKSGTYRKSETDLENEAMAFINNKRYGRK